MGNSQSQIPDDESGPRYSYHENVLRDAQTGFISCATRSIDFVHNDDEQYFSAEESDRCSSLTPERTRPESSSDENLSESCDGVEEITVEDRRSGSCEQRNLMREVDLHVREVTDTSTTSIQADVSAHQSLHHNIVTDIHDSNSIGCQLESTGERSGADSPRSNVDISLGNRSLTRSHLSEDQTVNISNPCQPMSSQSTHGLILNNKPFSNEESIARSGKRKISSDSNGQDVLPKKKMLTKSSSKRKRLAYTDSSESEMVDNQKDNSRKPNKKRKTIIQSQKKNRRKDHDCREHDSDERRFGKQRRTRQSKGRYESESAESDDEAETQVYIRKDSGRNQISSSLKRTQKFSCDESSNDSYKAQKYQKKRRSKRNHTEETDSDEKREQVQTRKSYRHASSQYADKNVNENAANHQSHQTQVSQSDLEDNQNVTKSNTSSNSIAVASVDGDINSRPCHTFKMGNQSLRNSHGKVFPLRHQKDSACQVPSEPRRNSMSDSSVHAANLDPSAKGMNKVLLAGKEPLKTLPVSDSQSSHRETTDILLQIDSNDSLSIQEHFQDSPFKNITLTPPSRNVVVTSLAQPVALLKLAVGCNPEEHSSDMEVEESNVATDEQTSSKFITFVPQNTRNLLRSRHRGKTVAAKFRHFWLEKKRNIGENLKSLFSKVNSPLEKSHNSISPYWQAFTSTSSGLHSTLRNSYGTQVKQSINLLSRDDLHGSSLASSLQNQVTPKNKASFSTACTSQPVETRGLIGADATPQLNNFGNAVTSIPFVNHGTATTEELPQMFSARGSKFQHAAWATNNSVEWLPQTIQYQVLNCRLAGTVDLSISTGDLTDQKTAGIVNWTDGALTHAVTSCSKSIATKAGALMRAACNDYISSKGSNLEAPDVLTTPAGGRFERAVEAILHVVEPRWVDGDEAVNNRALMEVFANCLRFASERLSLDSISFPLVGNGIFPFTMCVKSFFDAVLVFLVEQLESCNLSHIQLIIPDLTSANCAADLIRSYIEHVSYSGLESAAVITYSQYFGHRQHRTHHVTATNLDTSVCSQEQSFTVERTISGRPRLKRPRF